MKNDTKNDTKNDMKLTILRELVERKPRNERLSTKEAGLLVGRSPSTARKYLVEMERDGLVVAPYFESQWEITEAGLARAGEVA